MYITSYWPMVFAIHTLMSTIFLNVETSRSHHQCLRHTWWRTRVISWTTLFVVPNWALSHFTPPVSCYINTCVCRGMRRSLSLSTFIPALKCLVRMLTFLHHVFLAEINGRMSLTPWGNKSTPDDREEKTNRKRTLELSVNNGTNSYYYIVVKPLREWW